jgi:hypothetical protein
MVSLRRLPDREGLERGDYTMRLVGPLGFSISVSPAGRGAQTRRSGSTPPLERFGLPGMELSASSDPGHAPHVDRACCPQVSAGRSMTGCDMPAHARPSPRRLARQTLVAACTRHLHETAPPVKERVPHARTSRCYLRKPVAALRRARTSSVAIGESVSGGLPTSSWNQQVASAARQTLSWERGVARVFRMRT